MSCEPSQAAAPQLNGGDALVLMIDAGSASMTEVFAAAIQKRGRGLVIGQRSSGKGVGNADGVTLDRMLAVAAARASVTYAEPTESLVQP